MVTSPKPRWSRRSSSLPSIANALGRSAGVGRSCTDSLAITNAPSAIWPEVLRITTRGGMGLHLADYHLESARRRLAQDDKEKAREHLTTAKEMIERMGYHRRDKEVNELEQQLV